MTPLTFALLSGTLSFGVPLAACGTPPVAPPHQPAAALAGGRLWRTPSPSLDRTGARAWLDRIHLRVSQDNPRAARFYERQGLTRLFPNNGSDDAAIWFGGKILLGKLALRIRVVTP